MADIDIETETSSELGGSDLESDPKSIEWSGSSGDDSPTESVIFDDRHS